VTASAVPMVAGQETASGTGASAVPRHVAIIMDGNGRWAKVRRLPRLAGHRAGAEAVRRTIRAAAEAGVEALTLYAFSSENWRRPEDEISDLKTLLRHFLRAEIDEFVSSGLRLRVIGDHSRFGSDIAAELEEAIARTSVGTRTTVVIALNYGSKAEIVNVTRALVEAAAVGAVDPATIDEAAIEARLDTAGLPPLDLLIRTSGEQRLSNFLLWQAAYAELYFTERLWPDFDAEALHEAFDSFRTRARRYGGR